MIRRGLISLLIKSPNVSVILELSVISTLGANFASNFSTTLPIFERAHTILVSLTSMYTLPFITVKTIS